MFTGLISDVGTIASIETGRTARRFEVISSYEAATIALGASIAHDGVCLTVTDSAPDEAGVRYCVEVSEETLRVTTLGDWKVGWRVNLERSLALGAELGGHLVTGHVDGLGRVLAVDAESGSWQIRFAMPLSLAPLIARKGSVAVQGVSLTVNDVTQTEFAVNIIPHTLEATNLRFIEHGAAVNLEVDLIARYIARQREFEESSS
jgi:riboflavin synthase